MLIVPVVARRVSTSEFSFPLQRSPFAPAEFGVEEGDKAGGFVDFVVELVFVDERQPFRPPGVEEVVVFGGRPRCVFTCTELVSLRWTKSTRSARRCAASARSSFSSSCLIRWCSPVASGLASPSAPGARASSIAFRAFVSSW